LRAWGHIVNLVPATIITFTLPNYDADTLRCASAFNLPLRDLAVARLYGAPVHGDWSLVRERAVAFIPGARDTFVVPDAPASWAVTTRDGLGNESCWSNVITTGIPTTAVQPAGPLKIEHFDLLGRKVRHPLRNGVYYERINGQRTKRIVVIR
jgi:hypothetical protein